MLLNINHAHGVAHGKGIYFTNKFNMSLAYSDNNKDHKKYVLICKVLVGKIERGYSTMLHPTKGYNTTVNDCNNPTIFVKYNNTEYKILGYVELFKNIRPQRALATNTNRRSASIHRVPTSISGIPSNAPPEAHRRGWVTKDEASAMGLPGPNTIAGMMDFVPRSRDDAILLSLLN